MCNGDTFEEVKDAKSGFPKDHVKSVTSSPTPTNGDHAHYKPPFNSPPDINKATTSSSTPDDNSQRSSSESNVTVHFRDAELTRDLLLAVHADRDSMLPTHGNSMGFSQCLRYVIRS